MRQLSLLPDDDSPALAGVMPALRAAMNHAAGEAEGEGRKHLVDKVNSIAGRAGVRLTAGNAKGVSKDTLDKWLSPSDVGHPPSLLAVLVFCRATGDMTPLRIMARALGMDIMTEEDRRYRDLGRAQKELEEARQRLRKAKEEL